MIRKHSISFVHMLLKSKKFTSLALLTMLSTVACDDDHQHDTNQNNANPCIATRNESNTGVVINCPESESVNWNKVLQVHLAGHQVLDNGIHHDTHDQAVKAEVWSLYQLACSIGGPFPTLLEWDENVTSLNTVVDEVHKAHQFRT